MMILIFIWLHSKKFIKTYKMNGVFDDAIRLSLFPFLLRNKTKTWLQSLLVGSITTWEQQAQIFLAKYFPL